MVLLYTVAKETHLIIPKATSGPQWHSLEHRDKHIVTYSDMVLVLCYINISINISSTDIIQLQRT